MILSGSCGEFGISCKLGLRGGASTCSRWHKNQDILLRDETSTEGFSRFHREIVQHHISHKLRSSLRAYASILYLRKFKNFEIILRGIPVEQMHITEEMKFKKVVTYKPQVGVGLEAVSVRTTIGFAKEAPVLGIFGVNVYYKNRLIMPFWKVLQEGSSRGRSVVGVLEANFIEPAHDKQDFERTPLFIRLEAKLRQIIIDYWSDGKEVLVDDKELKANYPLVLINFYEQHIRYNPNS